MSMPAVYLIVVMLVGIISGLPIAWALTLSSLVAIIAADMPIAVLVQRMFASMDSFTMLAIPCFLVAGDIMAEGSISKRLIAFAESLFGGVRGGLGVVAMVSCTIFAALTGSALATTAAIGAIMYPAMKKSGYPDDFTTSLLAIGGTLGPVIPPSVVFIFYAQATELSVVKLFMSGFGPGVLTCILISVYVIFVAHKKHFPAGERIVLKNVWRCFKEAILALLMPLIILGGIYAGIFTPTESAAVAVIYGIGISMFVHRDVSLKALLPLYKKTAKSTANLMCLIASANLFGYLVGYFNIPRALSSFVMKIAPNAAVFMLLSGIIFLITGMFMEAIATAVIMAPIMHPLALNFGIDPIVYGCFMVFILCIGIATPPFAPSLFVACGISGESVTSTIKQIMPMVLIMILVAIMIAVFPQLATFVPNLFG